MVNSLRKRVISVIIILFLLQTSAYADVIYLKNGKNIEGKVIEETNEYIKMDFHGVTLTYWRDEIGKIETDKTVPSVLGESESRGEFDKGTAYLKERKWQEAIVEFKNVLSTAPSHLGAHFNLGCAYALIKEYDKAIEEFKEALSLEKVPFNTFCYFNIAGVYVHKGLTLKNPALFKEASENFAQAARLLPNFLLAADYAMHSQIFAQEKVLQNINNVSFSIDERGIPPDSALFLPESKIKGTGSKRIYFFDAEGPPMLYFFRSPNCSWRVCESKLDPNNPSKFSPETGASLRIVLYLLSIDKPDNRINKLIQWSVLHLFSLSYLQAEDWDRAVEFAEKAKDVGLNFEAEYIDLALAYLRKGNYQKARESAQKALEINPQAQERQLLESIIKQTEHNL